MAIAKRKKKFFEVDMPIIKKQTQLQAYEPKELDNKNIKYDLTRMLRGKGILLHLKVKVNEDKLTSSPKAIQLLPYYLKRMVRKGTNYVEDSFSANCKDAQLRIKPFLITRRKVSRAVRKTLRNKAKEELIKNLKNKTTNRIFEEILKNQLQRSLSLKLKKIYPLSLCEIRVLKVEKEITPKKDEVKKESKEEKVTKPIKEEKTTKPIKEEKPKDKEEIKPKKEKIAKNKEEKEDIKPKKEKETSKEK